MPQTMEHKVGHEEHMSTLDILSELVTSLVNKQIQAAQELCERGLQREPHNCLLVELQGWLRRRCLQLTSDTESSSECSETEDENISSLDSFSDCSIESNEDNSPIDTA